MSYDLVFTSRTGNTRLLAEEIHRTLGENDCGYFGGPEGANLSDGPVYVGFWTDKGGCGPEMEAFLQSLHGREVFLFCTCGFGGDPDYYAGILDRAAAHLPADNRVIGRFACQGKMPEPVRQRYLAMQQAGDPQGEKMLINFDRAASHPDEADLAALRQAVLPKQEG